MDGFIDAVIVDVVARCLCPEDEMIADVLLDEAVAIVAANHRVGQVHVLDLGLQLATIVLADLATEDHGDLVGVADRSIGIEQPLPKLVQRRGDGRRGCRRTRPARRTTDAGSPLALALSR